MKKIVVFIKQILLVLILVIIAMLLLNKQQSQKNPTKPVVFGSPYAGGPGGGSASAIWSGRIDGVAAK